MDQLKEYAEFLEDEIEALPEISKVEIRGVQDKEVKILVDLHKMESLEINFGDLANSIQGGEYYHFGWRPFGGRISPKRARGGRIS